MPATPAAAYDWPVHKAAEIRAVGHDFANYYGWHYPPTFLFVAAALATLPYLLPPSAGSRDASLPMRLTLAGDSRPAHRHSGCARISRRDLERNRRPKRLSHRGTDRRHARTPGAAAGACRRLSRASDLQAAIRLVVSAGADRRSALADDRGRAALSRSALLFYRGSPSAARAGKPLSTGCRSQAASC